MFLFSELAGSSCELEFYRHRLHLERESVRRAKQALSEQRNLLEAKQLQFHHNQGSSTLQKFEQVNKILFIKIILIEYTEYRIFYF